MLKRFFLLALCLFPASVCAQLRVELEFDQQTYLPLEELFAIVRVHNSSGQTLTFGKDNEWLTFTIEASDGKIVKQIKAVDVQGEFTLPSVHRAKKSVDLSKAFDLSRFARYTVTATVTVPAWGNESFSSKPAHFGITLGVKLWEQAFGIPNENAGERPEIRKYQVVQSNHQKHLSIYLRITDESDNYTYTIFPIGGVITFSRPEAQLDKFSNLHMLYQDSARGFRYVLVTPDGLMLKREAWELVQDDRPMLRPLEDGKIEVAGGVRRIAASDLPPPDFLTEKTEPSLPAEGDKPLDAKKESN